MDDNERGERASPRQLIAELDAANRRGELHHRWHGEVDYNELRDTWATWAQQVHATDWRDAWNQWVERYDGTVEVTVWTCPVCHGRRIDVRRGQICRRCAGRGRVQHTRTVRIAQA